MRTVLDEASPLGMITGLLDFGSKVTGSAIKDTSNLLKFINKNKMEDSNVRSSNYIGGSIAKYSKDLIMTFPTLIDNSLSPETASMISKANERNIVSMIQVLLASMQLRGTDGREIINKIYGPDRKLGGYKYDDYVDMLTNVYNTRTAIENAVLEDAMRDAAKAMEEELKRPLKNFPTDSFSDNSLNDYQVLKLNGRQVVKFAPVKEADDDDNDPMKSKINVIDDPAFSNLLSTKGWGKDKDTGYLMLDPLRTHDKTADFANQYNKNLASIHNRQFQLKQAANMDNKFTAQQRMDQFNAEKLRQDIRKANYEMLSKQLMDSDIKKANEMQPTMLIVNFSEVDPNDEFKITDTRSFVAGVKSRLISVNSSDIVDRIVAKNKTKVNFLNFIKASTGEINFMKDFIFCLNQAKIDARNSIKRGEAAEIWKTLERLSVKNKRNKLRKSGNDASAITTLVMNQETVNLIKKQYEIDLESIPTVTQIMSEYNLLGIIIADESVEAVKFLYDGQDMFETQSYTFLDKENNDRSYKKIINLMSQNRRF